jgi:hypothetical protein
MIAVRVRVLAIAATLWIAAATDVHAQVNEPIGPYVADARGVWARFPDDPVVADLLAVQPDDLPARGLGVVVGAHWYPLRRGRVTFGLGGELMIARGTRTRESDDELVPDGPAINSRMTSISPQLSLNFGRRNGWSYISGGLGWAGFTAERAEFPVSDPEGRTGSYNYGGGARWFTSRHIAFALDLRFYTIGGQLATTNRPAYPRLRIMVISAGVGLR